MTAKRRMTTYNKNIKKTLKRLEKEITLSNNSKDIITKAIKYFINYLDGVPLTELLDEQKD